MIQIQEVINFITKTCVLDTSSKAVSGETRLDAITYVVSLDSKARLVLPLEIRDFLGLVNKNQKLLIKLTKDESSLNMIFEKAPLDLESKACSKNIGIL